MWGVEGGLFCLDATKNVLSEQPRAGWPGCWGTHMFPQGAAGCSSWYCWRMWAPRAAHTEPFSQPRAALKGFIPMCKNKQGISGGEGSTWSCENWKQNHRMASGFVP